MTDQERQILSSLAETMSKTRDELDAMRCVLIALAAALAANPQALPVVTAALQAVMESDPTVALFSTLTDAQIQRRVEWISRLVPQSLLPAQGL